MNNSMIHEKLRADGPDYSRCLVNLANSVLKAFGAETTAATLDTADRFLARRYKNVVLLLLDVRRDPSADDLLMYRWIREAELEHAVVLTKCDKLSRMKCRERVSEIRRAMSLPSDVNIFPVSSTDRTGLEALWAAIDSAVEEE